MVLGPLAKLLRQTLLPLREADASADGPLLRRFAEEHDEAAFAVLVRRHGPMVFRVCQHLLRQTQDSEDAFQATFVVLARKAGELAEWESVAAWLHKVAFRIALKARGAAARRRGRERRLDEAEPGVGWSAPEGGAEAADLRSLLHGELDRLPEKYRAPVVLCYLQGKTNEEAARLLQWPVGTVKIRLTRARDMLRDRLARRGVALTAGGLTAAIGQVTAAPPMPAALLASATNAAKVLTAGPAGAQLISAPALALAGEALKAMGAARRRLLLAVLLPLTLVGAGAVFLLSRTQPVDPAGATWQLHTTIAAHDQPVTAVAFSPDGKTLASAGGTVKVWDRTTGTERAPLPSRDGVIIDLLFSPDGRTLAAQDGWGRVKLWEVAGPREPVVIPAEINTMAFSGDGTKLVARMRPSRGRLEGPPRCWDVATGRELTPAFRWPAEDYPNCWAMSPDGTMLAVGSMRWGLKPGRTGVKLWDLQRGAERVTLQGQWPQFDRGVFAADGKTFATVGTDLREKNPAKPGTDQELVWVVRLWDTVTGKQRQQFGPAGLGAVGSPAFSPDVRSFAHVDHQRAVHVWETETAKVVAVLRHPDQVLGIAFPPDGKALATACQDGSVRLWRTGKTAGPR